MKNPLELWRGNPWNLGNLGVEQYFDETLPNPVCDVEETDRQFLLTLDIPGISKDDLKIQLQDNQLTISGERKREVKEGKGRHKISERYYGSFSRLFTLPSNIDTTHVAAKYEDGVLYLTLPKTEVAKSRTIEIAVDKKAEKKSA